MNEIHLARWQDICHKHYDMYIQQNTHTVKQTQRAKFYDKHIYYEGVYWKLHKLYKPPSNKQALKDTETEAARLNKDVIAIPINRFWIYMVWIRT